jgi:hypothetical protein
MLCSRFLGDEVYSKIIQEAHTPNECANRHRRSPCEPKARKISKCVNPDVQERQRQK